MTAASDSAAIIPQSSGLRRNTWLIGVLLLTLVLVVSVYLSITEDMLMRGRFEKNAWRYQQMVADQVAGDVGDNLHNMFREIRALAAKTATTTDTAHLRDDFQNSLSMWHVNGLAELGHVTDSGKRVISAASNRIHNTAFPTLIEKLADHRSDSIITVYISAVMTGDSVDQGKFLLRANRVGFQDRSGWVYGIIEIAWLARSVLRVGGADSSGYAYLVEGDSTVLFRPEYAPPLTRSTTDLAVEARTSISCYGCGPAESWSVVVAASDPATRAIKEHRARRLSANIAMVAAAMLLIVLAVWQQRRTATRLRLRIGTQSEFLSAVLQASVDAIMFIDNDNRVQAWNRGAEMTFGYSADQMIGQSFHRLIPPEVDAEAELNKIRETVYNTGFIRNFQTQRITRDKKRITVNLSRTLITDNKGKPLGSIAILRDVTEEVELDKQLYHTEKLASIGILAAGVAHEINNPLAVILGFTDLLKERFPEGSTERADLTIIEETANNAKKIVENMLGFARVSEGQKDSVDVNKAIDAVVRITSYACATAGISLVTDEVRPSLPEIVGDPREYQQVLFNLVNNAVAAMADSGGRLSIAAWAEEDHVHVRISDTGAGIPERIKNRIFDPFFTTKRVGQGTGLGLSLSYGIVQKYGGDIRFTSRSPEDNPGMPGRTTFTVSMPIVRTPGQTRDLKNEPDDSRG